mgnify:CR=1 FL=1
MVEDKLEGGVTLLCDGVNATGIARCLTHEDTIVGNQSSWKRLP